MAYSIHDEALLGLHFMPKTSFNAWCWNRGMRFRVIKNPRIALDLIPWFTSEVQPKDDIYLELRHRLTYNPDDTFVCLAVEDGLIKGMVIAYCRAKDVLIWQANALRDVSPSVVECALGGVLCWAKSKGYSKVAGYPTPVEKVELMRRWGFKESQVNENEVYLAV